MRAAYFMVLALGGRPSRRTIQDVIRRQIGTTFRTDEVAQFLRANPQMGPNSVQHESRPGPNPMFKTAVLGPGRVQPGSASRARHKVLRSEVTPLVLGLEGVPESNDGWYDEIRDRLNRVDRPLRSMTYDERLDLARMFAFEAANCTVDRLKNERLALSLTPVFKSLCTSREFGDRFAGDYAHLVRVHREKIQKPFRKPWDVKAVLDVADKESA